MPAEEVLNDVADLCNSQPRNTGLDISRVKDVMWVGVKCGEMGY